MIDNKLFDVLSFTDADWNSLPDMYEAVIFAVLTELEDISDIADDLIFPGENDDFYYT